MKTNLVVGVVALVVVVAAGAYFISRRNQPTPIEAGIPIYPGSTTDTDSFAARLSQADRARLVKAVVYKTQDPPDKVIAFYKANLKGKTEVIEAKRAGAPAAVIRTEVQGAPKLIVINSNEDSGKTEITIGNIEPPK